MSFTTDMEASVRKFDMKVEIFSSIGEVLGSFTNHDKLLEFTMERVCDENKFFGFGVSHKVNIKISDKDREYTFPTKSRVSITCITGNNETMSMGPAYFYITRVNRDENNNSLSITAYDGLYFATDFIVNDIKAATPFDLVTYTTFAVDLLKSYLPGGASFTNMLATDASLTRVYQYANYNGDETLREVLDDIAEATQTIYYVSGSNLCFRRVTASDPAVLNISKSKYFELDSSDNRLFTRIVAVNELGDAVASNTSTAGTTQYVRSNGFFTTLEDADLETALTYGANSIGNLHIGQFTCSWRGNPILRPGDKITIEQKDGTTLTTYLLVDTLTYGLDGLKQSTSWHYDDESDEKDDTTPNLVDQLKKTSAVVNKVEQSIILTAELEEKVMDLEGTTLEIESKASQLELNLNGVSTSVNSMQTSVDTLTNEMQQVSQKVETAVTANDVQLIIQESVIDGVQSVNTTTGYTFNKDGLTISKNGTEMTTQITEDGMNVYKNGDEVLSADNQGVKAKNLHATTFLIIGANSRFEDYENGTRTGCFWIGA